MKSISVVTLTFLCLIITAMSVAADPAAPIPPTTDNVYNIGGIMPESLHQWKPLSNTQVRVAPEGMADPYFSLAIIFDVSKAGNTVHGAYRKGLGLPLPRELHFQAYGTSPFLLVAVADSQGHRYESQLPVGMKSGAWSEVTVPLADAAKAGLQNLDFLALLTMDGVGENGGGPKRYLFSHFQAVYPQGEGPQNPTFTADDLKTMIAPLDAQIARIQSLMPQAAAAGAETRYFGVSLAVLKRYRGEVLGMMTPDDPFLAQRTAAYLLHLADQTEQGLNAALKNPKGGVHVPKVSLLHLKARDGGIFSGSRPVVLAGVLGWVSPDGLDVLSQSGYSIACAEIGPSFILPAEGKVNTDAVKGIQAGLDLAAQHNMAFELLLSPHYMPGWAYAKWPDLDPENRRQTNPFMPWDVRSQGLREIMAQDLAVLIPAVKDKPALLDYDLMNEAWYRPFNDLDQATLDTYVRTDPDANSWNAADRYTAQQDTKWVNWYSHEIRKYDDAHPIYAKVLGSTGVQGVDREGYGDVLTANGMDAYPQYPDLEDDLAADFVWDLYRLDFHRTLTPNKPIFDGEYHAFSGIYDYPDSYIDTAMWAPALHGKQASVLWVGDRADGVSVAWHANAMADVGYAALDFIRLGPEIHAFQIQHSPLALFGDGPGVKEAYQAALFQDQNISVLTDKRVNMGALSGYSLLVLPGGCQPDRGATARIAAWEKSGGIVLRCPLGTSAEDLFPQFHGALIRAGLTSPIAANMWGIECRSATLGKRKLFYLINYRKEAVDLRLKSAWNLSHVVDLRTQKPLTGKVIHLRSLETRLLEAR